MNNFSKLAVTAMAMIVWMTWSMYAQWGISSAPFNTNGNSANGVGVQWAWTLDNSGVGAGGIVTTVKKVINWALWLLALVALIIMLRWGFNMLTAAGDEKKYGTGMTIVKQAAIGLIFIGVSWLIVSAIFYVITTITTP